ncbi:hypothetical protein KPH14_000858 [Odynerus spinipes]|uniref:Uncharacterized protein n=1 Tax=Odynerus spinipes TaxID=1348599 RepID=A0AAD9RDV2_9HYME|nr:hypothetical protein KPH14_000858 [Odynerus spinipes]
MSPRQPPTSSSSVIAPMGAASSGTTRCRTPSPLGCELLDGLYTKNPPLRPPRVERNRILSVRVMARCTLWKLRLLAAQHPWTTHTIGSSATIATITP